MTGPLVSIIISFIISTLLLFVPKREYQRKMEAIPGMALKAAGHNLRGWTYEKITSPATGMTHYYYSYASQRPNARTLLMLHGFNTDGRAFGNMKPLAQRYNLIAYNYPEESPLYKGNFTDFVTLLYDFCRTMGLDSVCVCGNSIGGAIAFCFTANSRRVKVNHLLLVSSEIFGVTEADRRRNRALGDKLLKYSDYKLYFLLDRSRALVQRLERAGFGEDAPREILVIRRIAWYRQIMKAIHDYDGRADLARITCPVIAFHGGADRVIPLENARTIPRLIPNAHFEVIPKRGHAMLFVDGEEIARKLLALCPDAADAQAATAEGKN